MPADLFTETSYYYARFRASYPDAFLDDVIARFALDGSQRLLDLGCGTGQLTIPLAARVAEAIGMDPELGMLAEARAAADRAGMGTIRWVQGGDRDLDRMRGDLGMFHLVTIGRAFHWMEQDATLRSLAAMIVPSGGLVLAGDSERIWSGAEPWHGAVRGVIQRWLGLARRAGSGNRQMTHDPFEEILRRSAFSRVASHDYSYRRDVTVDQIVGYLYSTSYCSPAVLGANREPFEAELRRALHGLNPAGTFTEGVTVGALFAWRP